MKPHLHLHNHAHDHSHGLESDPENRSEAARMIRTAVKIGCAVNILLMILKLGTGYFGHSEALFADGFHSLNDVAADLIMLMFVGMSYRKVSSTFTYGYGKLQTFSTFLMSTFLIAISAMICIEGVESIVAYSHGEVLEQPDIWTVIVVIFAMGSKEALYRYYSSAGKKTGSNALVANAWHHRSDALASLATLVGVTFSHFFGAGLRILDPIASLLIALFIFIPAAGMLRQSFLEMMEHSLPKEMIAKARGDVENIKGVKSVEWIRSRRNGHRLIFDIAVNVNPEMSLSAFSELRTRIYEALEAEFGKHITLTLIPA